MVVFQHMMMKIGSRKSDLAQIQARLVASELRKATSPNEIKIDHVFKDVAVDVDLNQDIRSAPEKGLFTKDLSEDLLQGRVDMVVHSWKDLPASLHSDTYVAATLKREDPRDLLLVKRKSISSPKIRVLSSSPRRDYNLGNFLREYVFPKQAVEFIPVRGNVPTRLNKFLESDLEAFVVAQAAVERLLKWGTPESQDSIRRTLASCEVLLAPLSQNPPAAAQGALAIEILKSRKDLAEILSKINDTATFEDVIQERQRLQDYGGGCHLKLGIYSQKLNVASVRIAIEKGLSPEGLKLEREEIIPVEAYPQFTKLFDTSGLEIFDRKALEVPSFGVPGDRVLFISKAEALTQLTLHEGDVLWAAGLTTFKKLREKGLWVSGTQDSFGEKSIPLPWVLWPSKKAFKLAHKEAPANDMQLLPTYEL